MLFEVISVFFNFQQQFFHYSMQIYLAQYTQILNLPFKKSGKLF